MDIRTKLERLGSRRQAARAELADTSAQIAKLVGKAHARGIPKTEIARLAQISRPALDEMLKRH